MRGHQPHDPFGGYPDAHALQLQVDPLVSIAPLAVLERLAHELQQRRVLVGTFHGVDLVMVRAARDADHGQQAPGGNAHRLANGLDEERLLSAGRAFPGLCPALFPTVPTRPSGSRSGCRARVRSVVGPRYWRPARPDRPASPRVSSPSTLAPPPDRPRPSGRRRPPARPEPRAVRQPFRSWSFPLRSFVTCVSLDPASIRRFQFLTTDDSTPSSASASCDFNRPDANATTASRFSSSGTSPCLSLRWPGASPSIHAMSSSLLFG